MDFVDSQRATTQLTITPIIAWRRWVVTLRRPWEQGSGAVLRGAWGRAWTDVALTARCLRPPTRPILGGLLDDLETARHRTPPPEPDCTCGIYAEKVNKVASIRAPRLTGRPTVAGFVELSGLVVEGSQGYRAREAVIVGPLELEVACAGGTLDGSDSCDNPATSILTRGEAFHGACARHAKSVPDVDRTPLSAWVQRLVPCLEASYHTPILHFEKGGTDGHR